MAYSRSAQVYVQALVLFPARYSQSSHIYRTVHSPAWHPGGWSGVNVRWECLLHWIWLQFLEYHFITPCQSRASYTSLYPCKCCLKFSYKHSMIQCPIFVRKPIDLSYRIATHITVQDYSFYYSESCISSVCFSCISSYFKMVSLLSSLLKTDVNCQNMKFYS